MLIGAGTVLTEGPRNQSRYRLGPTLQLDLDLIRYLSALSQGEIARALSIYRGDFMPGIPETQWVTKRRDSTRMALTSKLHTQMLMCREQREWRRLILLGNQYLRIDPNNLPVLEMRVDAARRVCTPAELGRYVAAMQRYAN